MATSPFLASSNNRCFKCSTLKKSGKHSCCARGGTWFKNCGDAGDTNFDHTWVEGIKACTNFSIPTLVESSLHVILTNVSAIIDPRNTVESGKKHSNVSCVDNIPNASDRVNFFGVAKKILCSLTLTVTCVAMMNWPAEWNQIAEVHLDVLEGNVAAMGLYEKWGFEVVQSAFFVDRPILKMVKKIKKVSADRKRKGD